MLDACFVVLSLLVLSLSSSRKLIRGAEQRNQTWKQCAAFCYTLVDRRPTHSEWAAVGGAFKKHFTMFYCVFKCSSSFLMQHTWMGWAQENIKQTLTWLADWQFLVYSLIFYIHTHSSLTLRRYWPADRYTLLYCFLISLITHLASFKTLVGLPLVTYFWARLWQWWFIVDILGRLMRNKYSTFCRVGEASPYPWPHYFQTTESFKTQTASRNLNGVNAHRVTDISVSGLKLYSS